MFSWGLAVTLLLGGIVAMALLSSDLSPQRPPVERPLGLFFLTYIVSWIGFALACRLAWNGLSARGIIGIVIVALVGRLIFIRATIGRDRAESKVHAESLWLIDEIAIRYIAIVSGRQK